MQLKAFFKAIMTDADMTLSDYMLTVNGDVGTKTFTYDYDGDGDVSVLSSDINVATASVNGNTVTVTYVSEGTAVITVTASETKKYAEIAATCTVTCVKAESRLALSASSLAVMGGIGSCAFEVTSQTGDGALTVSSSNTKVAKASIDGTKVTVTYVSAGSATITVSKAATVTYGAVSAACKVTCTRSASAVTLSAASGTLYGAAGSMTVSVTSQTGDGALSVSSSNTNVADVSLSGTTLTIRYVGAGTAVITVTKAATAKFSAASAACTVTCSRTSVTIPSLKSTSIAWKGESVTVGVNNLNTSLISQGGTVSANSIGTWTITWSLKDTTKYCWTDGTSAAKSASWSTYAGTMTFYIDYYTYYQQRSGSDNDKWWNTNAKFTCTCTYGTTWSGLVSAGTSYTATATYYRQGYPNNKKTAELTIKAFKTGSSGVIFSASGLHYTAGYVTLYTDSRYKTKITDGTISNGATYYAYYHG